MIAHNQVSPLENRTVGEIAAKLPGATAVFRHYAIDFCCQGDVKLGEAAARRKVAVADLEAALNALDGFSAVQPEARQTDQLITHILVRYHETHRREIGELVELARKVEAVHATHPETPRGLASLLQQLQDDLEAHMRTEEEVLFPAMLWHGEGELDRPITQMRHDHVEHGRHLQQLRSATNDFVAPEGACRSWQALYTGTAKLADDLIEHIHLENNVLFPRFQQTPAA